VYFMHVNTLSSQRATSRSIWFFFAKFLSDFQLFLIYSDFSDLALFRRKFCEFYARQYSLSSQRASGRYNTTTVFAKFLPEFDYD